jgi:uncharacterized membrane protein
VGVAKNKKRYHFLRFVTICMTSLMLPFGTFVGYEFGAGHTRLALSALAVQIGLTAAQSYIWWLTLEQENKR